MDRFFYVAYLGLSTNFTPMIFSGELSRDWAASYFIAKKLIDSVCEIIGMRPEKGALLWGWWLRHFGYIDKTIVTSE